MKDWENKKVLGVPFGTVVVLLGIGVAVFAITSLYGGKLLFYIRKFTTKPASGKSSGGQINA